MILAGQRTRNARIFAVSFFSPLFFLPCVRAWTHLHRCGRACSMPKNHPSARPLFTLLMGTPGPKERAQKCVVSRAGSVEGVTAVPGTCKNDHFQAAASSSPAAATAAVLISSDRFQTRADPGWAHTQQAGESGRDRVQQQERKSDRDQVQGAAAKKERQAVLKRYWAVRGL